jgi:hypothetical protein
VLYFSFILHQDAIRRIEAGVLASVSVFEYTWDYSSNIFPTHTHKAYFLKRPQETQKEPLKQRMLHSSTAVNAAIGEER